MKKDPSRPSYESLLVRSLVTLVVPQGFVAGAVAAFVALAVVARTGLSGSIVALPTGLRTLVTVVPLLVVLAVAGLIAVVPQANFGFPLAGLVGAGGYVVLLSAFFWMVSPAHKARE